MSETSGLCEGCYRTIAEIIQWGSADEAAKRAIWGQLAQRRARSRASVGGQSTKS